MGKDKHSEKVKISTKVTKKTKNSSESEEKPGPYAFEKPFRQPVASSDDETADSFIVKKCETKNNAGRTNVDVSIVDKNSKQVPRITLFRMYCSGILVEQDDKGKIKVSIRMAFGPYGVTTRDELDEQGKANLKVAERHFKAIFKLMIGEAYADADKQDLKIVSVEEIENEMYGAIPLKYKCDDVLDKKGKKTAKRYDSMRFSKKVIPTLVVHIATIDRKNYNSAKHRNATIFYEDDASCQKLEGQIPLLALIDGSLCDIFNNPKPTFTSDIDKFIVRTGKFDPTGKTVVDFVPCVIDVVNVTTNSIYYSSEYAKARSTAWEIVMWKETGKRNLFPGLGLTGSNDTESSLKIKESKKKVVKELELEAEEAEEASEDDEEDEEMEVEVPKASKKKTKKNKKSRRPPKVIEEPEAEEPEAGEEEEEEEEEPEAGEEEEEEEPEASEEEEEVEKKPKKNKKKVIEPEEEEEEEEPEASEEEEESDDE